MIARLIICFAGILLLTGCIDKYNTYGVIGIPAVSNDGKYIACVVAESEGITHQENGGFRKTTYSTNYWLKQFETATGKLLKKKKLVDAKATNPDIDCFGVYNNAVWIYANGIKAFDEGSLEETMNEEKTAAANGMKKTIFPYGSRLVIASVEKGYIDFTADNGEEYRLQLKNLKIINKQDVKEEDNAEQRTSRLLHKDDYGTRCDTFGNAVFSFAKDSTAASQIRPGNTGVHETAYRMKLFTGGYTIKKLGNHNSFNYQNIQQAGSTTFLNPCFAMDTYTGSVIHLSNPAGYLIIHQDVLGERSKAIITRIDAYNKKIWETASGVSTKIAECTTAGKYIIFTTNTAYMLSPHIGKDALCIIDTETGKIITPALNQ